MAILDSLKRQLFPLLTGNRLDEWNKKKELMDSYRFCANNQLNIASYPPLSSLYLELK
jgi:hypothetical protein